MGYSMNPVAYTEEEQALLLTGLGRNVRLDGLTKNEAINLRGRLYGLRKAALKTLENNLKLEKQGLTDLIVTLEVVQKAADLQYVSVSWGNAEHTSLVIGRNVGNTQMQSKIRTALGDDFQSPTDKINEEAAALTESYKQFVDPATGEVDFDAYMAAQRGEEADNTTDAISAYLNNIKEKAND